MEKAGLEGGGLCVAKVIVNLSLDRVFDYLVPPGLAGRLKPGVKVNIPFGNGRALRQGYVLALAKGSQRSDLKYLESVCEEHPRIPDSLLKLGEWMADYYCCSREHAVRTLLPGAVRSGKVKAKKRTHFFIADPDAAERFLVESGAKAKAKAALLKALMLHHGMEAKALLQEAGVKKGALDALVKKGLLAKEERAADRDPFEGVEIVPDKAFTPTDEQSAALKAIFEVMDKPSPRHVVLLHGVTGSGKTEVYLQAISRALERGGTPSCLCRRYR